MGSKSTVTEAPQCRAEKPCGPFGIPGHPEGDGWEGWVHCAACGHLWEASPDEYSLAVRAEDEYRALEGDKEAKCREDWRALGDVIALSSWEEWAAKPWPSRPDPTPVRSRARPRGRARLTVVR